jgi:hypothetical protein
MSQDKDGRSIDDGVDQWLGRGKRGELEPIFKLGNGSDRPDPSSPDGVLLPQIKELGFEKKGTFEKCPTT